MWSISSLSIRGVRVLALVYLRTVAINISAVTDLLLSFSISARRVLTFSDMYDENDGNTQVFYFRNATATFSSFTAAPETVEF